MSSPSFSKFKSTPESKGNTPSLKREYSETNGSGEPVSKKFGFGMKVASNVANKNKLGAVFNVNEDAQGVNEEPKKKLSRLDEDSKKEQPTVEDKRKLIKNLIEKIPTVKEDLFMYPLKWDIVDEVRVNFNQYFSIFIIHLLLLLDMADEFTNQAVNGKKCNKKWFRILERISFNGHKAF